jgi:di/tricarboxylate transporter
MNSTLAELGCLPLAERSLQIGRPRRLLLASVIFALAILATVLDLVPVQVAFVAAAVVVVLVGIVRPGEIYDSIDWPVIVLLGAMLPVGTALETTGGAALTTLLPSLWRRSGSSWRNACRQAQTHS